MGRRAVAFHQGTFGPLIALRTAGLDEDFVAFPERANAGPAGAPAESLPAVAKLTR